MLRPSTRNMLSKGCPNRVALTAFWRFIPMILLLLAMGSCKKDSYPKPIAFPRIQYPAADYQKALLTDVAFEYPIYTTMDVHAAGKEHWVNIRFQRFSATLFMSLANVPINELDTMLRVKEKLAIEQAPITSEVRKEEFEAADHRFTGYFYLTDGNAPCPIQFILSDHQGKLFQGSLLFDQAINRDSLVSVIDGLTRDVRHLVETFRFKN